MKPSRKPVSSPPSTSSAYPSDEDCFDHIQDENVFGGYPNFYIGEGEEAGTKSRKAIKRKVDDTDLTDSQRLRKQKNRESAARSR